MTVYIDVLLAINLYLTFLLLLAAEKLAHTRYGRLRRTLASVLGAVSSLTVLLPAPPWWVLLPARLLLALLLVWVASGERRWRPLLTQTALFFAANLLLAGGTMLLAFRMPGYFALHNGVVYVDLDVWTLLAATTLAYAAIWLTERIRARKGGAQTFRLTLTAPGGSVCASASVDTGNSLREPFSGAPAAVARFGAVEGTLPEAVRENVPAMLAGVPPEHLPPVPGLRLIPARTVSGRALLPAYGPVSLDDGAGGRTSRIWLAFCPDAALPQTDLLLPAGWRD